MERIKVESSNLESVGYDGNDMEVEFKGGAVYKYFNVPFRVWEAVVNADSVGKCFNERVKKGGYKFERVEESR